MLRVALQSGLLLGEGLLLQMMNPAPIADTIPWCHPRLKMSATDMVRN